MRIVSLNTWKNGGDYTRRLGLMAEQLGYLSADVVCLQEVFAADRADTAAFLASALGMINYPRPAREKARAHDDAMLRGTSGLAILSRRAAGGEAALALTSDPRDGERIAQRLDFRGAGAGLRILNLHLTHLRGETGRRLRTAQLAGALAWARRDWADALVVAGDLNAGADDPELAPLAGASPRIAERTFHGARVGDASPGGVAIDHCLLIRPQAWRARRAFVALNAPDPDGRFASDYAAVVLDLERDCPT